MENVIEYHYLILDIGNLRPGHLTGRIGRAELGQTGIDNRYLAWWRKGRVRERYNITQSERSRGRGRSRRGGDTQTRDSHDGVRGELAGGGPRAGGPQRGAEQQASEQIQPESGVEILLKVTPVIILSIVSLLKLVCVLLLGSETRAPAWARACTAGRRWRCRAGPPRGCSRT